jgi:GxxExxY protein
MIVRTENEISSIVLNLSIKIHRDLGPGLLESVYHKILYKELIKAGFNTTFEEIIPVEYDGEIYEFGYRADLIIENKVIVELKSVEDLASVHFKQLLTYLRIKKCKLGLLINFNEELLKDGFHRVVNGL